MIPNNIMTKGATIEVAHQGKRLRYFRLHNPPSENYSELKQIIESEGCQMATMDEVVSIVHDSYVNPDSGNEKERYDRRLNRFDTELCKGYQAATKHLYIPSRKLLKIFPDNGQIQFPDNLRKRIGELNENELEQILEILDQFPEKVNTVDVSENNLYWQNKGPKDKARTSYLLALVGEEGTKKIEEIVKMASKNGFVRPNFPLDLDRPYSFNYQQPSLSISRVYLAGLGYGDDYTTGHRPYRPALVIGCDDDKTWATNNSFAIVPN